MHANRWSRPFALRAIEEYRKFVFLALVAKHQVTPSDQVDQVWPLHRLFREPCRNAFCPGRRSLPGFATGAVSRSAPLQQRVLMLLRHQLRDGLVLFIGFAGLHLQNLFDDAIGEGVEVGHQGALQVEEFGPEGVVLEAAVQARHHGGATLAAVAVGADAVAAQQGHKQVTRPLIRKREAKLDRRLLRFQLLQARLDAFAGPFGRLPFPLAAGPGVERLDAAQFFDQLLLRAGVGIAVADGIPGRVRNRVRGELRRTADPCAAGSALWR